MLTDYNDVVVDCDIEVRGAVITITPTEGFKKCTKFILSFETGLKATNGKVLGAKIVRNFTTKGPCVAPDVIAQWLFEGNANDNVGSYDGVEVAIDYTPGFSGKAATFNGTTSIIEIPNADDFLSNDDLTLSFWMKTNSTGKTGGHFVVGLGAFFGIQYEVFGNYDGANLSVRYKTTGTETVVEDIWFPSNATSRDNGGWQGWDFAKPIAEADMIALLKDEWLMVTFTFDAIAKKGKLFYNGEKMKSFDFNLWPEGDAKRNVTGVAYAGVAPEVVNEMAFGFIQSRAGTLWDTEPWGGYDFPEANHFKGQLDNIVIFSRAITEEEVLLMYNSVKP